MAENLVSLNPDDFGEGGGLLDDVDGIIVDAKAVMYDYGGKQDPVPGALLKVDTGADEPVPQFWGIGSSNDWEPNADGTGFKPIGKKTQIIKNSNLGLLIASAINSGFPKSKVKNDLTVFVGMEAHFESIAVERKGLDKDKSYTTFLITKIHKLPGDAKGKGGSKGGGKATTTTSSDEISDDVKMKAIEAILRIAEAQSEKYPDGLPKAKVGPLVFMDKELKNDPDKKTIVNLVGKDAFLSGDDVPWNYDAESGLITIG